MPRITTPHWSERVKALHNWSLDYDWQGHVNDINETWGLDDDSRLTIPIENWPPAWFTSDIEALEPGKWVLVVSLNPAQAQEGHYQSRPKSEAWAFWRKHNLNPKNWNSSSGFFPRLVKLAAAALHRDIALPDRPAFATENMLFLEFCPYASKKFTDRDWASTVQPLADSDVGFAINRQIRHLAMLHGKPKLVLLHGEAAINDVKDHQCPELTFSHVLDPNDSKRFKVWQGEFRGYEHTAPMLGFTFLGRPGRMPGPDRRVELLEPLVSEMISLRR